MFLRIFFSLLLIALFSFGTVAKAADSYNVDAGQTVNIDEFGVCKDVTNTLGVGIMVPTKTANEWYTGGSSFLENLYAGVSAANCPPPCGGLSVGGYCWYAGSINNSCDNACAARGGCDLVGTRDYAGSNGTDAQCESLVDILVPGIPFYQNGADVVGCVARGVFKGRHVNPTTCSSTHFLAVRICACNN